MKKSATILGQEVGLSAQEMNYVLKQEGYLAGEPNDYAVTAKGAPFAEEHDFHRGNGGYSWYNRYWTTITWDDSILNELEVTDQVKEEAKAAVSEARRKSREKNRPSESDTSATLYENQAKDNGKEDDELSSDVDIIGVVASVFIIGLILHRAYKAAQPHVVNWWNNTIKPKFAKDQSESEDT